MPTPSSVAWKASCDYGTRLKHKCNLFSDIGNQAPHDDWWTVLQAFIGSFLGILTLSGINYHLDVEDSDLVMITGSFGAQAVLIYAAPAAPLAQPWHCMVGNMISAFVGVSVFKFFKEGIEKEAALIYLASALSVALSIAVMIRTRSLHPPAGASSLIAVTGSEKIHRLGYWYILFPVMIGSALQVTLGLLLNNLSSSPKRLYPVYWSPVATYDVATTDVDTATATATTEESSVNTATAADSKATINTLNQLGLDIIEFAPVKSQEGKACL
jgi:CBS-domain-containing membrane protein